MLPDRVSNPGPLTYESGALPIALRGPAQVLKDVWFFDKYAMKNTVQNKMQITLFLMANKNIDFDHVCHVIVYK